jgi:quercetin dioxygenase-like cupin family protein
MANTDTAVRLSGNYDVERLLREVRACESARGHWLDHKMVAAGTSLGRSMLQLRSRGGQLLEKDNNDEQLLPFQDTPLMAHAPYVRQILDEFDAHVSAVLFLALEPGGKIKEHIDGPAWQLGSGHEVRLHIPIVTNPDVWYVVGGQRHDLRPGELWYGDFSQPHWFENRGQDTRIYLMINTRVSEALFARFPAWYLEGRDVKPDPPPYPPTPELLAMRGFSFELGGLTPEMDHLVSFFPAVFQRVIRAAFHERNEVRWIDGKLWVVISGRPMFPMRLEGPRRMRVVEQPAFLEFDMDRGVPTNGKVEVYIRDHTFQMPVQLGPLT